MEPIKHTILKINDSSQKIFGRVMFEYKRIFFGQKCEPLYC
jgi:hypothetical protein